MASYISSNDNRFYVALESDYGKAAAVAAGHRIPAVKLTTKQQMERALRKDKTGTRTFLGEPAGLRRTSHFGLLTYMTGWTDQTQEPAHGPLFEACLGGSAAMSAGGTIASVSSPTRITFAGAHGLAPGQAVSVGGEMRFVAAVADASTVVVNAPFSRSPSAGEIAGATATYQPASSLKSATIADFWSPGTAVQRLLCGAALNEMKVSVNGDFHEFQFLGDACDLLDNTSFESGQGALSAFPAEPEVSGLNYSIIPGHLGQAWLGSAPDQFFTLTKAELIFHNDLELRAREFGASQPRAIAPGIRTVTLDFSVFQQDDTATKALYQAARQRSPVSMMLQLGQQQGQLFGIYLKSVVPETPEFDDSERRQQWTFAKCRAQGGLNDEVFFAFG
jgi:hypothetical protein